MLLAGIAGELGRQVQRGNLASQVIRPILGGALLFRRVRVLLALPAGVVGVLDGRSRQRRRVALAGALVSLDQVVHQDRVGPGVRGDVVHVQQQDVVIALKFDQGGANQRRTRQVKRCTGLGGQALSDGGGTGVWCQAGQVLFAQVDAGLRVEHLSGFIINGVECGFQHVVPVDDLLQGCAERRCIQRAAQVQCVGQVVGAAVGRELLQEPQALLGEGQGSGAAMGGSLDGML